MKTSAIVDWVEGTTDSHPVGIRNLILTAESETGLGAAGWRPDKSFNRYSDCILHLTGVRALCGREDMGTHYIASGQALSALVNAGITERTWIEGLRSHGMRPTRVDLALELFNSNLKLGFLLHELHTCKAETRAREGYLIKSGNGGLTLYIGAPQSNKHIRAYNKAAELNDKAAVPDGVKDWIRVELVMMREQARYASQSILESGVVLTVKTAIKDFVDFPTSAKWGRAMAGQSIEMGRSERKTTDTRYWLMNVVARVVAKQMLADGEFMAEFLARVESEFGTLASGLEEG